MEIMNYTDKTVRNFPTRPIPNSFRLIGSISTREFDYKKIVPSADIPSSRSQKKLFIFFSEGGLDNQCVYYSKLFKLFIVPAGYLTKYLDGHLLPSDPIYEVQSHKLLRYLPILLYLEYIGNDVSFVRKTRLHEHT